MRRETGDPEPGHAGVVFAVGVHGAAQPQRVGAGCCLDLPAQGPHPRDHVTVVQALHQIAAHLHRPERALDDPDHVRGLAGNWHEVGHPGAVPDGV